jgi:ArsR family transcriptional regulator, arsenate/arsenite/antimonite-responsive transcriptional repressor / arsenate reductase (thioredoxin)
MNISHTSAPPALLALVAHELRWRLLQALAYSDHKVQELVALVDRPQNLVSYHLKQLRQGGLVQEHRSAADARDVYYAVDLEKLRQLFQASASALHPALVGEEEAEAANAATSRQRMRVLFLCTHNSARSQMAEALLRELGKGEVEVFSAGSEPATVHPLAIQTLAQRGIDLSGHRSKDLTEFVDQSFDYIITVCDRVRESCPVFPGDPEQIHWSFEDPAAVAGAEAQARAFVQTAQQLTNRIHHLLIFIRRRQGGAA